MGGCVETFLFSCYTHRHNGDLKIYLYKYIWVVDYTSREATFCSLSLHLSTPFNRYASNLSQEEQKKERDCRREKKKSRRGSRPRGEIVFLHVAAPPPFSVRVRHIALFFLCSFSFGPLPVGAAGPEPFKSSSLPLSFPLLDFLLL